MADDKVDTVEKALEAHAELVAGGYVRIWRDDYGRVMAKIAEGTGLTIPEVMLAIVAMEANKRSNLADDMRLARELEHAEARRYRRTINECNEKAREANALIISTMNRFGAMLDRWERPWWRRIFS